MILVGQYDSPFVRRVAVSLHHYGMPFIRNAISVFGDAREMAKITPIVRIPSLILDDGKVLVDSGAILDYLDQLAGPSRSLTPLSGAERQEVLQVMAFATGAIDKGAGVVYERHLHSPQNLNQDWIDRCRWQLAGSLAWLEKQNKSPYFLGNRLSQADITTGVAIGYLKLRLAKDFPVATYPTLERLSAKLEATDEFIAARPSPNETMPDKV